MYHTQKLHNHVQVFVKVFPGVYGLLMILQQKDVTAWKIVYLYLTVQPVFLEKLIVHMKKVYIHQNLI